jgi:argininosuccinate lyase
MKDPIWKKDGDSESANPEVMAFLAGEDVELDKQLLIFDIQASAAHVRGLQQIEILTAEEAGRLGDGLQSIEKEVQEGTKELDSRFEDGPSAIE